MKQTWITPAVQTTDSRESLLVSRRLCGGGISADALWSHGVSFYPTATSGFPSRSVLFVCTGMIGGMTVHMTEAELARDVHAVLEKVRQGVEVIIEQGNRPVAVLKAPRASGRKISNVIGALTAEGANAVIDEDFARDVEDGIKSHREPWRPPSWD